MKGQTNMSNKNYGGIKDRFKPFLDQLLKAEGGFTDNPNDTAHQKRKAKGHKWDSYCTNMGITQATLSDIQGSQASVDDIKNLDEWVARGIYIDRYIIGSGIQLIPNDGLAMLVADTAVHSGGERATIILQKLLGTKPDGVIGRNTRGQLLEVDNFPALINAYCFERMAFMTKIIAKDAKQAEWANGWITRVRHYVVV